MNALKDLLNRFAFILVMPNFQKVPTRKTYRILVMPRETQRGPENPRVAQRGPERPREAQRSPERPREAQRGPEWPREAQRGPERPSRALGRQRPNFFRFAIKSFTNSNTVLETPQFARKSPLRPTESLGGSESPSGDPPPTPTVWRHLR